MLEQQEHVADLSVGALVGETVLEVPCLLVADGAEVPDLEIGARRCAGGT
ncbi:hypothetical protein GCM10023147_42300 [Tsukamurella soli]|uniref:Uncharacterized protein n=1 Tax=Tsukamurella soli TaxID=644556 RepID=A0ABP8K9B1_9ACTN